ncbi:hypothetical protein GCM10010885_23780 [Alicyclobacillus cellulosilyticus]|uniref:Uncharacterized protein n=1 Tax=Alicyclobacillus cellulosilyticus TaxID=1003997 RepID=A0A917KGY2_9BACL|nr:hypothetical protein GCM10010885_23780 [Alicyclobacillus cellulosilyticus]
MWTHRPPVGLAARGPAVHPGDRARKICPADLAPAAWRPWTCSGGAAVTAGGRTAKSGGMDYRTRRTLMICMLATYKNVAKYD